MGVVAVKHALRLGSGTCHTGRIRQLFLLRSLTPAPPLENRCKSVYKLVCLCEFKGFMRLAVDIDPFNRKPGTRWRVSCASPNAHASGLRLNDNAKCAILLFFSLFRGDDDEYD
jgi:hypothetical protein